MNLHEFELRYRAYKGLNYKFNLNRDENTIIKLVSITNKWILKKKIQEVTPEEIHTVTVETYTKFKNNFLTEKGTTILYNRDNKIDLETYINRLEYELKVIKEMGFNTYFLIVADFVGWAKKNMIVVGPWRWSWAGSLLARVIRITDVDPLPFGLLFERFLNPARVSMPDFDIDFEDELREKVIEYVTEKYGKDKVCAIWTYMKMATKAAFKDAARAVGLIFDKSNQFSNLIPEKTRISEALTSQEENKELKALYHADKKIQEAVFFGEKLEGNLRQLWVHACGIIIAPEPITTYSAAQYIKDNKNLWVVSQYDGPTLETIWLLKMDFLWLRNLSVIKNCIKIIQKRYQNENRKLDPIFENFLKNTNFSPQLDDKTTFEKVFQTGNTTGIFQFESKGMRRFLVQLEASSIDDLVAMNALYRPGPMEFIPTYIERKHWREKVSYMQKELKEILLKEYNEKTVEEENNRLIKDLDPIMNVTYGIAVYQEQLMFLVQAMAWFSLAEADLLRRWVGKKKLDVIEKLKKEFIKKSKKHKGYKKETAKFIYEKMIEPAASYSFNKSHSVCYSLIAYQTAYLKAHFPIEFYAALIRSVEEDTDELSNYIYEAQLQGIEVLAPDISKSFNHVAAIDNKIRLGFLGTKWLWREIWEFIQEERKKNGEFTNLEDFLKRCDKIINKKSLESLTKSGALDAYTDRNTILKNIEQTIERSKSAKSMNMGLFGGDEMTTKITFKNTYTTSMMEKLFMEQEVFKAFVSGHPLDGLYRYIKKFNFISQFKNIEDAGNFVIIGYIKNIQRARKKWFFVQIEDISWQTEFFFREILDLKKFDIIYVYWYKGRWISIEKIVKTSREKLIKQSWSKYHKSMTATKVKWMRVWEELKRLYATETPKEEEKEVPEIIEKTPVKEIIDNKNENEEHTFKLPESINKINKLLKIIKENKWNIEITIWKKIFHSNEKAIKEINKLLNK